MLSSRFAGLGLAAALLAGGAVVPVVAAPAQAAVVAPVVVAASKPKFKTNLPVRKIVTVGKTTTLKVKASGGSLDYQWYYAPYNAFFYKPVGGKAGTKSYLKVKATLGKSGGQYMVVVRNEKGSKKSRAMTLLVRSTPAKPFGRYARGYTAHWSLAPIMSSPQDQYNGKTLLKMVVSPRNLTSKTLNPKGKISIGYRDKTGKIWWDKNANGTYLKAIQGYNLKGINQAGSAKKGYMTPNSAWAAMQVPSNLVSGGRWVIKDKASPAMALYFKG